MSDSESEGPPESDDSDEENIDIRLYHGVDNALDRIVELLNEDENEDVEEFDGPYLDYLHKKFDGEYYPAQNVSIDECMVPFKGRLGIKQYIKDKPNKWGIKTFLLWDFLTTYCFRFEIYIARNSEFEGENLGLTAAVKLSGQILGYFFTEAIVTGIPSSRQ
ncbi:unnamed protein product [Mytilus coruscus]|uniref:PiggyBac transposable element-derived protein domain-containing protein n=1 Tax=Mytilus coruscus TaxID=42192 RepID=A0A6J8DSY3_MYTCO|nr:unnamed protein product [Mytilus coruscus]